MVPNPLPAPVAAPVSISVSVSFTVPITVPITVAVSVSVSVPHSFTFPFALSFALLLPLPFFLTLLFSLRLPCSSLGLALLLFGAFLPLGDFSALTGDFFLHGLQVGIFLVTLGPSRTNLGSVLLICLCAVYTFLFCGVLTNFCLSKFADLLFNCADVNETFEEGLGFSVDTSPVQRSVDKGDSFAAVECQQLSRVPLDFLLGDLKHRLCDLLPLIL